MRLKIATFILLCIGVFSLAQQKHDFWADIQAFKAADREHPPQKGAILFVGSSSFTKWRDVAAYFPGKTVINRGFGGSRLSDLNYYAQDLLAPYHPKQIIIYCGDNDFAAADKPSVDEVFRRFREFYAKIRALYPLVNVGYVSIKHSPSRENLWPKIQQENRKIQRFLGHQNNTEFIDITHAMEGADGKVRQDLFVEDHLHMTPEGYKIWAQQIAPFLK